MKILKEELKKIITEEIGKVMTEMGGPITSLPTGIDPVVAEWVKDELNLIWNKISELQHKMGPL